MLDFSTAAEEEATFELFDLCSHAKRLDLEANETTFNRILSALRLTSLREWVYNFNFSQDAPYHNSTHEMLMTCYAFMAAAYHDLKWEQMRALVTAACMHDYDHTAGLETPSVDDSVNIDRALDGVESLKATHPRLLILTEWSLVTRLIRCTRYPQLTLPADMLEQIMVDADYCMPYVSSPTRETLFAGLHQELTASGRIYTLEAFVDGVIAFYTASEKHTEWARAYAVRHNQAQALKTLGSNLRTACANH